MSILPAIDSVRPGGGFQEPDFCSAREVAGAILGMDIKGFTVRKILVGPAADIVKEYYLAAVLDRAARRILLMGSAEGGVEIETVADERPEAIVRIHAHPTLGLPAHAARRMSFALGLGAHLKEAVTIAQGLVRTMTARPMSMMRLCLLFLARKKAAPIAHRTVKTFVLGFLVQYRRDP